MDADVGTDPAYPSVQMLPLDLAEGCLDIYFNGRPGDPSPP